MQLITIASSIIQPKVKKETYYKCLGTKNCPSLENQMRHVAALNNEKKGNIFRTNFSNSGHSGKYFRMGEVAEVLRSNSTYDVVVCASRISL